MSWQRQVIVQSPSNSPGFDPFNSNSWSRWLRPLWLINCLDLSQAAVDPTCRIPSSYWFILVKHFLRFHDREETAYQILSVLNCEDVLWRVTLFVTFVTIFHTVILTLARRHFRRVKVSALSTDTHTPTENSHFSCGSSEELFKIYLRHGLKAFTQSGQVNSKHVTRTHTHTAPDRILNPSISIISEEIMYWASLATEWLFCLSQPATAFAALRRQAPSESLQNLQRAFSVTNRVDGQAGDRLVLRYAFLKLFSLTCSCSASGIATSAHFKKQFNASAEGRKTSYSCAAMKYGLAANFLVLCIARCRVYSQKRSYKLSWSLHVAMSNSKSYSSSSMQTSVSITWQTEASPCRYVISVSPRADVLSWVRAILDYCPNFGL